MRIVAGRYRGRAIQALPDPSIRPTADRARQAVFDILSHGGEGSLLVGARVLDAFAGTGAMGLEALSRGAEHVVFMDKAPSAIACIRANLARFGERSGATVLVADALKPPPAAAPASVVFLDPPFGAGLAAPALQALARQGWFAEDAIAVVETDAREIVEPAGFEPLDDRRYGRARFRLLRHAPIQGG